MNGNTGADIYQNVTDKPITQFILALDAALTDRGFLIHNRDKMNVIDTFTTHGVPMPEMFDLHMIHICHPGKAGKSMAANPERAALIPKFIVAFSQEGKTQVRMLRYAGNFAAGLVYDAQFPASLEGSFTTLTAAIEEAL